MSWSLVKPKKVKPSSVSRILKILVKPKKAFDMPFSWLFSIIAGAFILFIAIYATVNFIKISTNVEQSQSAQQLLNYMNPIVSGITSGQTTPPLVFSKNTRIYFDCSPSSSKSPFFGKQSINFSEQTGFLKKWSDQGQPISRYNKYIFAENIEEGKTFYVFSKPFFAGFKVDDLIFISSDKYCFIAPPENISEEVTRLNIANINVTYTISSCPSNSVKVCFGSTFAGCNITVYGSDDDYSYGKIVKNSKAVNYFGSLIYAGIFSSPQIYECNVKRLSNKISELSKVYSEKTNLINQKDCNSVIGLDLTNIQTKASSINSSLGFVELYNQILNMDSKNCDVNPDCRVYAAENC